MKIIGQARDGFVACLTEEEAMALVGSRRTAYDRHGNPLEAAGLNLLDMEIDVIGRLRPLDMFEIERAQYAVRIGAVLRRLADEADKVIGELGPEAPKESAEKGLKS